MWPVFITPSRGAGPSSLFNATGKFAFVFFVFMFVSVTIIVFYLRINLISVCMMYISIMQVKPISYSDRVGFIIHCNLVFFF